MDVFPIAPGNTSAYFADQFDPRTGGHHGTDIFAPEGTPLVAVVDGQARAASEGKGGLVVYLKGSDGADYYYAHLSDLEGMFPRAVKAGDVIGYVGTTGNAQGRPPHLHFQISRDGDVTDPYVELAAIAPAKAARGAAPSSSSSSGAGAVLLLLVVLWYLGKGSHRETARS